MRYLLTALCALLLMSCLAFAQEAGSDAPMPEWNPAPGQIVHMEIPSLNLDESAAFYGNVFGWTTVPGPEGMEYMFWSDGGSGMGGFTVDAPPMDGGVVLYIYTENISDAYVAIEAAGGVPSGMEVYVGEGFIGMFHDPHGNLLGLFASEASMPHPELEEAAAEADPHAGHNH
ncbi:MAG: hypothetical protein H7A35_06280 [Planctomycetales bacterium]|nr:hypothetical protein [bacterium]UNM09666.1 MAG: hypothetical protein H7A35_06280 [Planctomycetales bacterium]